MRVEIFEPVAGRRWAYPAGVHDVPEEIARKLVDAGHARKIEKPKARKTTKKDDGDA
jgi:hypothetical protein